MTRDDMIVLARDFVHDPSGSGRSADEWARLLNIAQDEFVDAAPLYEIESTVTLVAGSDEIVLPANKVAGVAPSFSLAGSLLQRIPHRDLPAAGERTAGEPIAFALFGDFAIFDAKPTAATTLGIVYAARLPALPGGATSAATPPIPAEFHRAFVYDAAAMALLADRGPAEAGFYAAKAATLRARAARTYESRHEFRRRRGLSSARTVVN